MIADDRLLMSRPATGRQCEHAIQLTLVVAFTMIVSGVSGYLAGLNFCGCA